VVFWNYIDRINNIKKHLIDKDCEYFNLDRKGIIRKILNEKMILRKEIMGKVLDFKTKHWSENVLGVHVRYTDRKVSLKRYERPIKKFINKFPEASIFLATDSRYVTQFFSENYKKIISTPKVFPENDGALHNRNDDYDRTKSGIYALLDMYLLAECDGLIYTGNSTFSWISSILTKASPENLVDVEKWNIKVALAKYLREAIP
jgi:hypothetical protein